MSHSMARWGLNLIREAGLWLSDVTTGNASTAKHGLLPKLDGNAGHFLDGTGAWGIPTGGSGGTGVLAYAFTTRSSNAILNTNDSGRYISATAAFTQTFDAAATLGAGWYVVIKNDTTDGTSLLVLDPDSTEQVDGLGTITLYSGDTRLVMCTGTAFETTLLQGGFALFTADGTFVTPPGVTSVTVDLTGGGAGGGGGQGAAVANNRRGGSGGGGGSRVIRTLPGSVLGSAGSSIAVTVGAITSAAGGGAPGNGTNGDAGNNTTFGTIVTAYGGGPGRGGNNTDYSGGSGAGWGEKGVVGATAGVRGGDEGTANLSGKGGAGAGADGGATAPKGAEYGGGCGGGQFSVNAIPGGTSIFGGAGGGCGGSVNSGNPGTMTAASAGGNTGIYGTAGGGGGAIDTAGAPGNEAYSGTGGGGGSSSNSTTGSIGKDGGAPGGGGGGGGGGTNVGGAGGKGARGECRVWYS